MFGYVKSLDNAGEIGGNNHLIFADKRAPEDREKPEAVGDEDVVKHLAQFFILRRGPMLLDCA